MNISIRIVKIVTAYMIALAVVELPTLVIDVLAVPVPRLAFGMSWFTSLAVAVLLTLFPVRGWGSLRILGLWDAAYVATVAVWVVLEAMAGELDRMATVSAILAWLSPWLVAIAVRLYASIFGDIRSIVRAFVTVVVFLGVGHLGLLLIARVGVTLPFMRLEEVIDRNSISLLIVAAAFLLATWDSQDTPARSWGLLGIVVLGFVHADLNNARSAKLVLVLILGVQAARMVLRNDRRMIRLCVLLCVVMIGAVIGIAPLLQWLGRPGLFGGGDAAASTAFRGCTNLVLFDLFRSNPWFGVGWHEVLYARCGGYISHTLYLNIPAAYGIVGLLPALTLMIWRGVRRRGRDITPEQSMTAVFVVAVASFINDPLMWYGLALALPSAVGAKERAAGRAEPMTLAHLRPYYPAAGAVAVVTFAVLAFWIVQREPFVASTELEIARTGAYEVVAVEASSEAEEFVQLAVFQYAPALRDRCSVSGRVERQALMVSCKGETESAAVLAVEGIVRRVLQRHETLFDEKKSRATLIATVDRSSLKHLQDWALSLQSHDRLIGTQRDSALLSFLNLQRAVLEKNLATYERTKGLEHPSRLVDDVSISRRSRPWLLCIALAVAAALTVLLSLGIGEAARAAVDVPPR